MDTIGQFLGEACVLNEPKSKITSSDLYAAYKLWSEKQGNHPKANRTFSHAIIERGHKRTRMGSVSGFAGIRTLTLSELAYINDDTVNDEPEMRVN